MSVNSGHANNEFWLVNGEPHSSILIRDRGLAYGDGLFETMSIIDGRCAMLDGHLARLATGCERLNIAISIAEVRREFDQFLNSIAKKARPACSIPTGVVKLIVTRGVGGQGYTPPDLSSPNVIWQWISISCSVEHALNGVRLSLSPVRLAKQPLLAGIKHLNRLEYVLAAQHASAGDIPLLLDTDESVIETLSHNLFLVKNNSLITPSLENCGVAGVLRQLVFTQLAAEAGLKISEGILGLDDFISADEVFIGNSVRGFWPVTQLSAAGNVHTWLVGPVCRLLQRSHQLFLDQVHNV